jgi:hypothetical protein
MGAAGAPFERLDGLVELQKVLAGIMLPRRHLSPLTAITRISTLYLGRLSPAMNGAQCLPMGAGTSTIPVKRQTVFRA